MWLINDYKKNDTEYFEYSNIIYYTNESMEKLSKEIGREIIDLDVDLKTGELIIKPPKKKENNKTIYNYIENYNNKDNKDNNLFANYKYINQYSKNKNTEIDDTSENKLHKRIKKRKNKK